MIWYAHGIPTRKKGIIEGNVACLLFFCFCFYIFLFDAPFRKCVWARERTTDRFTNIFERFELLVTITNTLLVIVTNLLSFFAFRIVGNGYQQIVGNLDQHFCPFRKVLYHTIVMNIERNTELNREGTRQKQEGQNKKCKHDWGTRAEVRPSKNLGENRDRSATGIALASPYCAMSTTSWARIWQCLLSFILLARFSVLVVLWWKVRNEQSNKSRYLWLFYQIP